MSVPAVNQMNLFKKLTVLIIIRIETKIIPRQLILFFITLFFIEKVYWSCSDRRKYYVYPQRITWGNRLSGHSYGFSSGKSPCDVGSCALFETILYI